MKADKKQVKQARKTFQSNLKASRMHYRREKRVLQKSHPRKGFMLRRAEKAEVRESKKAIKAAYHDEKTAAKETFHEAIRYVSPRLLKAREIKTYRLPHSKNRLKLARKHLAEVREKEKANGLNPKFHFQKDKTLERLQAEKEVRAARHDLKHVKQMHKHKKTSTKVKRGLSLLGSEALDVVSQDDDLEGARTLRETVIKSKRYARFTYQSAQVATKAGQSGFRWSKQRLAHTKERFRNVQQGKGWTRTTPLKPKRHYQTFLKGARKQTLTGVKGMVHAIKSSLTFFSTLASNPVTWLITGLFFFLVLVMSFVMSVSGASLIQQDEVALTKAYTHMTWEDANQSSTNNKDITYYTKIDDVMAYMNHQYQDYALDETMENGQGTYKAYLSQVWQDLNGGSSLKTMSDLYQTPKYKLSDEDQADLKELSEEGVYQALQELDNPFQGQTEANTLTMTYRYGYDAIDKKPELHHHILLEAKENQVIVAPMDGKVSLDGQTITLSAGKGLNKVKLTLFDIATGRVSEGQAVKAGDIIGQTKDNTGLKVTYQKVDTESEKFVYVNPAFYFPKVIQLQTTILPTIGQFGGDEFQRAKAIYEYLKKEGATNQAIAAILGNWSVESSINPKRAEGDYLSPPVGASDTSWEDEAWLSMGGPAIYNGRYPQYLKTRFRFGSVD